MKNTARFLVAGVSLWVTCAYGFDYSQYHAADLDEMIEQARPKEDVDILPLTKLRVIGTLAAYGEPCQTGFLKKAMSIGGVPQAAIDAVPMTRCIKLRSAKGHDVRLFIQDPVAEALPKEIRIGAPVTLFVLRVFNNADGPGLLTSEFSADSDGSVQKRLAQLSTPSSGSGASRPPAGNGPLAGLRGEWLHVGQSFACETTTQGKIPPNAINPDILIKACLHMGPFGIGDPVDTVTATLGPPVRTLPQPKGVTAWVYFLDQPESPPYLVVTSQKNKIVALQVSGPATSKDFTFNHIKLGDSTQVLASYFGAATVVKPSGEKDTDLWAYPPWPFSFEVKNGLVTSIRISDSADQK